MTVLKLLAPVPDIEKHEKEYKTSEAQRANENVKYLDPAFAEKKKSASARRYERIKGTEKEKERSRQKYLKNKAVHIARSKKSKFKRVYGITFEDYNAMFLAQNGVCAICRGAPKNAQHSTLSVDHCHSTGKVRGLLCDTCNRGIGYMKDNPMMLRAAADYLEKSR